MTMKLLEVNTPATKKEFLQFPVRLYKNEENWIRPLDKDIEAVFDPAQNKTFRNGECTRWILQDNQGTTIGRVAAFVNHNTSKKNDQPTGGMGFFECVEDKEAAFMLLDQCRSWLEERGMEAMDGPINFGERDKWWGLLVDGFHEPNYCMPYNFPYYREFLEDYGFQLYFKQFTYKRPMGSEVGLSEGMKARAQRTLSNPDYEYRHLRKSEADKAPEYFRSVYNQGWGKHAGVKEISSLQAKNLFNQLKPVIDWRLIWFGFYQGEPVAFMIMIPELNQIFKYVNGKLDLWGKVKFLYHKLRGTCKRAIGLVFGVVPSHQAKGIEAALIVKYTEMAWKKSFPYKELEMNWIGDFNPKMMRVSEQIGAEIYKTHHTYRKLFDSKKEFKRMPII